jgi:hypothetical protein
LKWSEMNLVCGDQTNSYANLMFIRIALICNMKLKLKCTNFLTNVLKNTYEIKYRTYCINFLLIIFIWCLFHNKGTSYEPMKYCNLHDCSCNNKFFCNKTTWQPTRYINILKKLHLEKCVYVSNSVTYELN